MIHTCNSYAHTYTHVCIHKHTQGGPQSPFGDAGFVSQEQHPRQQQAVPDEVSTDQQQQEQNRQGQIMLDLLEGQQVL